MEVNSGKNINKIHHEGNRNKTIKGKVKIK